MQFEIESNIEKSVKEQHRVGRLHRLAQPTAEISAYEESDPGKLTLNETTVAQQFTFLTEAGSEKGNWLWHFSRNQGSRTHLPCGVNRRRVSPRHQRALGLPIFPSRLYQVYSS
jgi:hypothetical protein